MPEEMQYSAYFAYIGAGLQSLFKESEVWLNYQEWTGLDR